MMELTTVQTQGVDWITKNFDIHNGVLLADRPGLGKTAQAIAVMKTLPAPALVICPAYIIYNWYDEMIMWGMDNICVIDSGRQIISAARVYIVSYNMAVMDAIWMQLLKREFGLLVLDESHALKAWNSKRSRRILGNFKNRKSTIIGRADKTLCMTGTPVINRVDELYNVLIRVAPDALLRQTKDTFIRTYAAQVWETPWGTKHSGIKNEKTLRKLLETCMLSRQKIEGLGGKIDKKIPIELKGKDIDSYMKQEEDFLSLHRITPDIVTTAQTLTKNEMSAISAVRQSAALLKIPMVLSALDDMLEKHDGILIYVYHHTVLDALTAAVKQKFPRLEFEVISGKTSMKNRAVYVKNFSAGLSRCIIATIGALKEGVNLTAADAVIFVELDWTPAALQQCVARAWRKGQEKTVMVYWFFFRRGIDAYIMRMLTQKQTVIDGILAP